MSRVDRIFKSILPGSGRDDELTESVDTESPSREALVRLVLFAPDGSDSSERENAEWVPGPVTLSLSLFVTVEKFSKLTGMTSPFEFESSDYGPRDPELEAVLAELIEDGLVESRERTDDGRPYDEYDYRLTETGVEETRPLYEAFSKRAKHELAGIRYSAVEEMSHFVLDVHTLSPGMFERELIRT